MTVPVVSGLAANCSTLWFQQLRRSCPVSETAGRPVDSKRSSVSRTHLSDTNVDKKLTVVNQVARNMARQRLVDNRHDLEHDALPLRNSVQLAEHRRDVVRPPSARNQPGGGVLN